MKKYFFLIIFFFSILSVISIAIKSSQDIKSEKKDITEEKRAIFLSYIELQDYMKGKEKEDSKKNIDMIIENLSNFNFNMLILQVRSFSDAIYESKIYPWSSVVSDEEGISPGYDILEYFIKKAHEKEIEVHAWINPYRIRNTKDISTISKKNKAYEWLNTNHVKITEKGIYYNPASLEVQKFILDGIEELASNYNIDGIHFDDYFYPDPNIDIENYQEYLKSNDSIPLDHYHLLMVNKLIENVHKITQKYHILFGISPEGNIDNNYSSNFADVYEWGKSNSYLDYLMPQIYYGFYNEAQPFYDVVRKWNNIVENSNVKILPALAFYKTGMEDPYAKGGSQEWIENNNMIMRQILVSRNMSHYDGFAIFRYHSIFNPDSKTENTMKEIKNLKKIMKP